MPHVIVEYSANLEEDVSPRDLIDRIHATILETGVYPIGGVRVRAARRDLYAIADRDPSHAFCAILIRMRTCVDVLVLLFGARVERIAQILILVFERLERLDHRQGIERRAFLRLLLRDPLAQVVARRAAGERGHDKREARQTERDGHLRAHQPPPFFGAAAGAGFFGGMPFFVGFAAA